MRQIEVQPAPLELLGELLTRQRFDDLLATAERARQLLAGRVVWNVNATAHGGGVAEMLQALLAYGRGAGVDTRWLVLDGSAEFFAITKRVHNALHGERDPNGFSADDHRFYQGVLADNLSTLRAQVRPGDIVILHDPQTAGLVAGTRAIGANVIWRSHIGRDTPNAATEVGWSFLRDYLEAADAFVFSRACYAPAWLPTARVRVIAPSIDPFAVKNIELDDAQVGWVLRRVGLLADGVGEQPFDFTRRDGSRGAVRYLRLLTNPPPADARLVVQVSRWDRLKDMAGVLAAFADFAASATEDVHLMLIGPDIDGVSDDPEGAEVLAACRRDWAELPEDIRRRCHLVSVPMDDADENAIIVNAIQRHATVVVQKSLVEGFGLTVTEAMWKSRPVLASAIGGIRDQITDGRDGVLLPDPKDRADFVRRLRSLIDDPLLAMTIGRVARERVRSEYLGDRHLIRYVDLFADLIGASRATF